MGAEPDCVASPVFNVPSIVGFGIKEFNGCGKGEACQVGARTNSRVLVSCVPLDGIAVGGGAWSKTCVVLIHVNDFVVPSRSCSGGEDRGVVRRVEFELLTPTRRVGVVGIKEDVKGGEALSRGKSIGPVVIFYVGICRGVS